MILKCTKCGRYTLSESCKVCKTKTRNVHPLKFSVADKYGKYRRMAKENFKCSEGYKEDY